MLDNLNWLPLDLSHLPSVSGIYAFKQDRTWLYIGESQNISVRLNSQHMPFQIALALPNTSFLYCHRKSRRRKREIYLIKALQPEWNGKTAWGYKYPCCILPEHNDLGTLQRYLEVTPEQRKKAVLVIGF